MRTLVPAIAVAAALFSGCADEPVGLTLDDLAAASDWPNTPSAPAALRRLTQDQYDHVLHDLFGPDLVVPTLAEPDLAIGGLTAVGASAGSFSPRGAESVEDAAFSMAAQIVANPALRSVLPACDAAEASCLRDTLAQIGRRLYRAPLTGEQLDRVVDVATQAGTVLGADGGLEFGLATLLQSPHFLYRSELGPDGTSGDRELSGVELASRLSFLLWDTAPDEALLDAAEAGELDTREGLFDWAVRMLDDARARRGIRSYFADHLGLESLDGLKKDPLVFERYSTQLADDAREETLSLLEWMVLDADADFRDVMTTRETFLSPYLASLYGVPSPSTEGFAQVQLPAELGRAGLLGQAAFLASNAHAVSSSATLRGKFVRTNLLCQAIPAPPVDVDTSIPEPSGTAPTLRDRVAEHLEEPSCAGCHRLMDPIGLGLENFDGIGVWRERDNGVVIDPSGSLDGTTFDTPLALGKAVREHGNFPSCTVRTLARYATGRIEPDDADAALDLLTSRFTETHGHRARALILELVMSPVFRRVGAPE